MSSRSIARWASVALLAGAPAALAERAIEFAPFDVTSPGALIVAVGSDGLGGPARELDERLGGALSRAVAGLEFAGEPGESMTLGALEGYTRVGLVGIGSGIADAGGLRDLGGAAAQLAATWPDETVAIAWDDSPAAVDRPGAQIAFGALLGQYRFDKFKTEPQAAGAGVLRVLAREPSAARAEFETRWRPVADAVRFARDLVSEPANELYPETFVERTRAAFEGLAGVEIEVLDPSAMRELGMGALLGVGQGSRREPRLLVVSYRGADGPPVVFAGKGITFDSGGISIKQSAGMWKMKYDMAGAAAVTGAVLALAGRRARVHAVAIAALAENMPAAGAQRPGDVVRTMSDRTVEIHSTDAEGRLVLADAVWYAQQRFSPRLLIDVATLTGSVRVALGEEYAGLFTRDDELAAAIDLAGRRAGEPVWRLPLHPSYAADIESDIADIKNISGTRLAGAGVGAQFIGEFVEQTTRWAHLDIAGVAWRDEGTSTAPKGATGYGVRLLDQLVRDFHQ